MLARIQEVVDGLPGDGWLSHGPSFWLVDSSCSEAEIRDRIARRASGADSVLVLRVADGWASVGLDEELTVLLSRPAG